MFDVSHLLNQLVNIFTRIGKLLPILAAALVIAILLVLLTKLFLRVFDIWQSLKQKYVFIEVTPPKLADKTPQATSDLFTVLHGIGAVRNAQDRVLRRKITWSFEVTSKKEVRFIARVPEQVAPAVKSNIASYLPSVRVVMAADYLPRDINIKTSRVVEFRQTKPYAFPLKPQASFQEHDPMTYLTNVMSELKTGEHIALQVVMEPIVMKHAAVVAEKILRNEDLLAHLNSGKRRHSPLQKGVKLIGSLISGTMAFVIDLLSDTPQYGAPVERDQHNQMQVDLRLKPARSLSAAEQELNTSINDKVRQPLFRTELRALVITESEQRTKQTTKTLNAPIAAFDTTYQSLRARYNFPVKFRGRYRLFMFKNRLLSLFPRNSNIFAASEIADIYHFPASAGAVDSLATSYSRTLAAPLSLRQTDDFEVVLGINKHHGKLTKIGLTPDERQRHMYVIGGTGNGKTTLLKSPIMQDILAGRGVGILDPHGDLAEFVARNIPEERLKDVVYFNPDDIDFPIGINLLEINPDITGSDRLKLQSRTVEVIVEALRKVFSDDGSGGHRIESVLRNALLTAMTVEDATLFTVLKLLRNQSYRKKIVAKLDDQRLVDFWDEELGKAGDMQRVSMTKGVTTKLDRFESDPIIARIFGQTKSTINFDDILDGKIFICNLSKGRIGPDNSTLLGTTILSLIQLAAEARARKKEADRIPFNLYVDEFQNFATLGFAEIVAEARKYKLFLTMAEQTTSQQDDRRLIGTILANVGTIICFRTGNPDDERLLLPFFGGFLQTGEINSLPAYNFYARLASVNAQAPLSGETVPLQDNGSDTTLKRVVAASRTNYATKYVPVMRSKAVRSTKTTKSGNVKNPTAEQR
jgi:hypothetical protein